MLKGISASPGIGIGKVYVKKDIESHIEEKKVDNADVELKRLDSAINKAKTEIEFLYKHTLKNIGEKEARIFKAHIMILDDPEIFNKVRQKIKKDKVNSEWAIKLITEEFIEIFCNIENEYIKERTLDLKDVTNRVIRKLLSIELVDLSKLKEDTIIVAKDLTPSDTARINKGKILGFITESGGRTSHSAIMARTLDIPAVVGVSGVLDKVKTGDFIVFDGEEGTIIINPEQSIIDEFNEKKSEYEKLKTSLNKLKGKKSKTKDGFEVELVANIGTVDDIDRVIENDGEGVGLYRTEFLYMDRDNLPTEEEQFNAYKIVAERLTGKSVVIRTLDIGGDKKLPYLQLPDEINPFLGYRAIRLCLKRVDIFKTQLRALLRASAYGNIKIMFPMISSIEELRESKRILEEVKEELKVENIEYDEEIEVGIMVEVPSVAITSDLFAKEVDFFSIGTNDLIQYITAVDRGNRNVSHLYNQFHPALLRLIKYVIDSGYKEGISVGICGEAAGDPKFIPILIGMGLCEFSMSPTSILNARRIINQFSKKDMEDIITKIINLPTASDVERFIKKYKIEI